MDVSNSIIIGVLSGVLSTTLLFLLSKFTSQILIPWYQNLIYNGTNIGGVWYAQLYFDDGSKAEYKLAIKQNATKLNATMIYVYSQEGKSSEIKNFKLSGYIKERFIHLNGVNIDNRQIGIVSYLFEFIGNGNVLKGEYSCYDTSDCQINSFSKTFVRERSEDE